MIWVAAIDRGKKLRLPANSLVVVELEPGKASQTDRLAHVRANTTGRMSKPLQGQFGPVRRRDRDAHRRPTDIAHVNVGNVEGFFGDQRRNTVYIVLEGFRIPFNIAVIQKYRKWMEGLIRIIKVDFQ